MKNWIQTFILFLIAAAVFIFNSSTTCSSSMLALVTDQIQSSSYSPYSEDDSFLYKKNFRKSGKQIVYAFKKAYPHKVEQIEFRNNDWALKISGTWFHYCEGRLLPEGSLNQKYEYTAYPFYRYEKGLPPLPVFTEQEKKLIEAKIAEREFNPPHRHPGIYNALWRISDEATAWERVKNIYFLGKKTQIHRELLEELAAVEEEIMEKAKTDSELKAFIASIADTAGYTWRKIADTNSLSCHAYGIAIDIIPKRMSKLITYWLWAKEYHKEWYSIPYKDRFIPPLTFIEAFERHGFIWGGKWFYFDTIHFEYKPEILILNGWDLD
ncbi:MAG: M15 family metallopeptidase [Spirochaetales bacterium]|nr:M15 family metallopeptidase [Spirochaetales bacterium]